MDVLYARSLLDFGSLDKTLSLPHSCSTHCSQQLRPSAVNPTSNTAYFGKRQDDPNKEVADWLSPQCLLERCFTRSPLLFSILSCLP